MSCPCGTGYQPTIPNSQDSSWDLLFKIAASLSAVAGQSIPSGGAGNVSSFNTAPDITVAVTGTAVRGLDIATPRGIAISAYVNNSAAVYVGGSNVTNGPGSMGLEMLQAGMAPVVLPISNLNQLYVNGTGGDRIGVVIL